VLTAFVLEYINRVITVVFKFVPMRLGVDEAASGFLAQVLGFGTAPGVTLAIVRKARILCWTALGIVFLIRRGLTMEAVLREASTAAQAPQTQ
jgi:hypothetical protein